MVMGYQLTERVIKLLCGKTSYDRGGVLYRDGYVSMLKQDPDARKYEAEVKDQESGIAYAEIDSNGDVYTECSCIDYGFSRKRCRHIAALLLNIRDIEQTVEAPMRPFPSLLHPSANEHGRRTVNASALTGKWQKLERESRMRCSAASCSDCSRIPVVGGCGDLPL